MSGTFYCHECEERRSVILTPMQACSVCGCNYIEEIPTVIEDGEDFNRELDFFFFHEGEEDDDEEMLEERCLYEQLSSIYNHPIARNMSTSQGQTSSLNELIVESIIADENDDDDDEEEEEEEEQEQVDDIVAYNILFEQRENANSEITTSIFQLPFARIGRLLDTMYSNRSDEESEEGDGLENYHQRSFLDNLADILSDYTQDIETTSTPAMHVILSSLEKRVLLSTDPDIEDECIICQDAFGTTLEIFHLPCNHKFHGTCISRWLNIKTSCPVCRQPAYKETNHVNPLLQHHLLGPLEEIISRDELNDNLVNTSSPHTHAIDGPEILDGRWLSSSPSNYQLNPIMDWASMEEVD